MSQPTTLAYARDPARTPTPWLHRYALATVAATFVLIIAGGIVTTRGAGLAVPDWPLSYGQLMPERWYAIGNIAAEHSHRMIAATVALMMFGLALAVQRAERRPWVRTLAWLAFAAIVAQALLGGATVLVLGPARPYIRVFHAALAQTYFMLVIALATVTSTWWRSAAPPQTPAAVVRGATLLAAGALFVQLMLGAVMRHTESGLALLEFPASFDGRLLPPTSADELRRLNHHRSYDFFYEPVALGQVWINFAHRAAALPVAAAVIAAAVCVLRRHADEPRLVSPALLLVGLLVAQVALGALTVTSHKHVWITTLHVGTGVLMFATAFALVLRARRLTAPADAAPAGARSAHLGVATS